MTVIMLGSMWDPIMFVDPSYPSRTYFLAILILTFSNNFTNYSHCDLVAILSIHHSTNIFTTL